jgi:hypothetical protein
VLQERFVACVVDCRRSVVSLAHAANFSADGTSNCCEAHIFRGCCLLCLRRRGTAVSGGGQEQQQPQQHPLLDHFLAGTLTGVVQVPLTTPVDLAKIQIQNANLLSRGQRQYQGSLDAVRQARRSCGWKYNGAVRERESG